jgi:class III poly(R)-hydroxyalkanoic acid synthase PhaE subunit
VRDELWRQWQAFAALWTPAAPGAQAGSAGNSSFGFAPFIDAAERFKSAAQSFLATAGAGPAAAAAEAAQKFGEFLRDQFADARPSWNANLDPGRADRARQASWGDWPALGPMRKHQQRWQRMADAGRRVEEAQRRLQRLWSDALRQAAADFAARLKPPLPDAADAEALRKLYDTWVDCAEEAYARSAHSEAFCDAQAELVNASSQWRAELRVGIEQWAKLLDLPTRSEINTLAQRLRSIEQQLRAAQPGARSAASESEARAAPRKPSSARPRSSPARHKHARRKAKR